MSIPTIDIRQVWLDEAFMTSTDVIQKLTEKEITGKTITSNDAEYAKICGAYLYLYNLAKESNMLNHEDQLTKTETIH